MNKQWYNLVLVDSIAIMYEHRKERKSRQITVILYFTTFWLFRYDDRAGDPLQGGRAMSMILGSILISIVQRNNMNKQYYNLVDVKALRYKRAAGENKCSSYSDLEILRKSALSSTHFMLLEIAF